MGQTDKYCVNHYIFVGTDIVCRSKCAEVCGGVSSAGRVLAGERKVVGLRSWPINELEPSHRCIRHWALVSLLLSLHTAHCLVHSLASYPPSIYAVASDDFCYVCRVHCTMERYPNGSGRE